MADPKRGLAAEMLADVQGTFYRAVHFFKIAFKSGATARYMCDRQIPIPWGGFTWMPDTISFSDIQMEKNGMMTRCTVLFMGPSHPVSALFKAEPTDGNLHTLTIYEAHLNDDYTLRDTPTILITGLTTSASRSKDGCSVQVANAQTAFDKPVPRQTYSADICQNVWGGDECQYPGRAIGNITKEADARVNFPSAHGFSVADTIAFSGIVGMTELNGVTAIVQTVASNAKVITSWGATNPAQINKVGHDFSSNEVIYISGCGGADAALVNGLYFVVTKVNDDQITIPVDLTGKTVTVGVAANYGLTIDTDSTGFTAYVSGGYAKGTWCNHTLVRCQILQNEAYINFYPNVLIPGQAVTIGSSVGVASQTIYKNLKTSGQLGIVKEGKQ